MIRLRESLMVFHLIPDGVTLPLKTQLRSLGVLLDSSLILDT